jgi:hypothetical protein
MIIILRLLFSFALPAMPLPLADVLYRISCLASPPSFYMRSPQFLSFLQHFAVPHFFKHVSTTYTTSFSYGTANFNAADDTVMSCSTLAFRMTMLPVSL